MALHALDLAEDAADGLILAGNSDSDVVSVFLDNFDLRERLAHLKNTREQVDVGMDLTNFVSLIVQVIKVFVDDLVNPLVELIHHDSTIGHEPLLNSLKFVVF